MRILITEPNGPIGRMVLSDLLAPEFSVRVIARDPSLLPEEFRTQVEVVRGATEDVATLRRALDGVEALFWCVPPAPLHEVNVRAHHERLALAGWHAIRAAGTPRVAAISAVASVAGRNPVPASCLNEMEDILNQSGAAIRHLRCGWFMENFLAQAHWICGHGVISYPIPGDITLPMTAAKDVADAALRLLVRRDWSGIRRISVLGPGDLSFNQAAAIFEQALDAPVRYTAVAAHDYVRNLVRSGTSVHHALSAAATFAALARGIPRAETPAADSTTSITLADWTSSELLPRLKASRRRPEAGAAPARVGEL